MIEAADMREVKGAVDEIAASESALFPSPEHQLHWNDLLTRVLARADARVMAGPVIPNFDRALFVHQLAGFDFSEPRPLEAVLGWTIEQLEHGVVHVTHPRYFGLFNPAPSFPAQCADRLTAVFNPQLASSTTSPAAVDIEAHVIRSFARRSGLPPHSGGHFTIGGTEANATAMACALTSAADNFAMEGARAFSGPPRIYVSQDSHRTWLKIAHQAGIGRSAVRLVPTDGVGRMDATALADIVGEDRVAGGVPVMIAATAGTTNAGMIDPLATCAAIARDAGIWYHVDAAWGGALVTSDALRHGLSGLELADSMTIDPHKWLATSMGCGMFLTARPDALSSTFHVSTSYMPSNIADRDPYVTSAQWSRRFLGLRLFLSLAVAGWRGYGRHVERSVALTRLLEQRLTERRWRVLNETSLAVLCFQPPAGGAAVRSTVQKVVATGRAWVSEAVFEGQPVLRACIAHGRTRPEDIATLVDALFEAARPQ